jgi:hypothetical protein
MIIEDRSSKEEILAALEDFVFLSKTTMTVPFKTRDVLASVAGRTQNPFAILSISSFLPVSGRPSKEEAAAKKSVRIFYSSSI